MIRITLFLSVAVCLSTVVAWAAGPVTVTSPEPFHLNSALVPVAGVPSWLVLPDDVIATDRAGASIKFGDGSYAILYPNSSARYENDGNRSVFRLLSGGMDVMSVPASDVRFYTSSKPVVVSVGKVTSITTSGVVRHTSSPLAVITPKGGPPIDKK